MVRIYLPKDYPRMAQWYEWRDLSPPPEEYLPSYGLIAQSIAAGFLIRTDAGLGILEYYITNPDARAKDRNLALDEISIGLLEHGRRVGLRAFKCDTQIIEIGQRALSHKFQMTGQFLSYFLKE